jgi:hypothetical protein
MGSCCHTVRVLNKRREEKRREEKRREEKRREEKEEKITGEF